jgi:hypothetical protein
VGAGLPSPLGNYASGLYGDEIPPSADSNGNATQAGCANQGGYWDQTDTVTGCNDNTGGCGGSASICGGMVCFGSVTVNVDSSNSWSWNFTKSFFTFAGGPGNKPTCAAQTLRSIGNELTGGFFTGQATEASLKTASVYQTAKALQYAAGRPNSLGGIGLICPLCSSVFRGMMSKAEFLGEASEAVPLAETSYAAANSIPEVSTQARNGECAAALPVF